MNSGSGAAATLAGFIAVSACLHALLLLVPVTSMRAAGSRGPGSASTLTLRLQIPAEAAAAAPVVPTEPVAVAEAPAAVPPAPAPDRVPEPEPASEASPEPAPPRQGGPVPAEDAAAVPVPQIIDSEYLPSRLLDVYPKPMSDVPMVYPDAAATQDMSGRVKLLLLIDEIGTVVEASVVEADPPGYFEQSAIDTFRGVLFSPGMRDGHPVKSRLVVEVAYEARTESARGTR